MAKKKFGRKIYTEDKPNYPRTKRTAINRAKELRSKGYNARVTKNPNKYGWLVWKRKRK